MVEVPFEKFLQIALERRWDSKLAKWGIGGTQSLLTHTLNVVSATNTLMDVIGSFTDKDQKMAVSAAFIHDLEKEEETFQKAAIERKLQAEHFRHKVIDSEKASTILSELGIESNLIDEVIAIAESCELAESPEHLTEMFRHPPKRVDLVEIVSVADQLSSLKDIDRFSFKRLPQRTKEKLERLEVTITYHKVSMVRGMITQLVHKALEKLHARHRYTPLLYFTNGAVYLSSTTNSPFTLREIQRALQEELNSFFGEKVADKLGSSAFGRITGTHIASPEFIFISEQAMRAFWSFVSNQKFIQNPTLKKEYIDTIVEKNPEITNAIAEEIVKEVRGILYLLVLLKDIAVYAANGDPRAKDIFITLMKENFSATDEFFKLVWGISHTTKFPDALRIVEIFIEHSALSEVPRKKKIEQITEKFLEICLKLREYGKKAYKIPIEDLTDVLSSEIEYPLMMDPIKISKDVWKNYLRGKPKGTDICVFCGKEPLETATASLVGSGTETFTNFLAAGSNIGGANKMRICMLCMYEAKIRSLYFSRVEEAIYIVPQISIGREAWSRWQRTAEDIVEGRAVGGLTPLTQWNDWAEMVDQGKLNQPTAKLLSELLSNQRKQISKNIQTAFKETYDTFEELKDVWGKEIENTANFRELADKVVDGVVVPPPPIAKRLEEVLETQSRTKVTYESPNYIFIFSSRPIARRQRGKSESETSTILRKIFVGLTLAKLFQGSVIYPDFPLELLYDVRVHGCLKLPVKLGLRRIYAKLGVDAWIPPYMAEEVIRKVSALILLESRLRLSRADFGMNTLLEIATRLSGEVLNRYVQAAQGRKKLSYNMVRLLNMWEDQLK